MSLNFLSARNSFSYADALVVLENVEVFVGRQAEKNFGKFVVAGNNFIRRRVGLKFLYFKGIEKSFRNFFHENTSKKVKRRQPLSRECRLIKYLKLSNICLKKPRSFRIINVTDEVGCGKAFGVQVNKVHSRDKLCDVWKTRRAFIAFRGKSSSRCSL